MASDADALREVGELNILLRQLGIQPTIKSSVVWQGETPIYTVTVKYTDGYSRRRYSIDGEPCTVLEVSYLSGLKKFSKIIMTQELGIAGGKK